jgi:hypothetical protein
MSSPEPTSDPYDSPEYQRFVEDMAKHCRCSPPHDCPCAGVLAGGICDDLGNDPDIEPPDDDSEDPLEN